MGIGKIKSSHGRCTGTWSHHSSLQIEQYCRIRHNNPDQSLRASRPQKCSWSLLSSQASRVVHCWWIYSTPICPSWPPIEFLVTCLPRPLHRCISTKKTYEGAKWNKYHCRFTRRCSSCRTMWPAQWAMPWYYDVPFVWPPGHLCSFFPSTEVPKKWAPGSKHEV